ncbi:ESX-1 secretion-associated protein EspI-like [Pogoniulus pusillus]|uniref:ESX-1 secretion-associated protein EspI-like n=1 Tax=Pogoniulus pusillus TaxID=488313 RepID=UPI0030B98E9A
MQTPVISSETKTVTSELPERVPSFSSYKTTIRQLAGSGRRSPLPGGRRAARGPFSSVTTPPKGIPLSPREPGAGPDSNRQQSLGSRSSSSLPTVPLPQLSPRTAPPPRSTPACPYTTGPRRLMIPSASAKRSGQPAAQQGSLGGRASLRCRWKISVSSSPSLNHPRRPPQSCRGRSYAAAAQAPAHGPRLCRAPPRMLPPPLSAEERLPVGVPSVAVLLPRPSQTQKQRLPPLHLQREAVTTAAAVAARRRSRRGTGPHKRATPTAVGQPVSRFPATGQAGYPNQPR